MDFRGFSIEFGRILKHFYYFITRADSFLGRGGFGNPPKYVHCVVADESSTLLFYLCRAQSGTGKTATFSIAILQGLDTQIRETQALVLSPTRELANQIQKVRLICAASFA